MYIILVPFLKICFNKILRVLISNTGIAITVDFTIMLLYKWENKVKIRIQLFSLIIIYPHLFPDEILFIEKNYSLFSDENFIH